MGTFVVFGGTGFVGRSVVHHLCAEGHRVIVPTRSVERQRLLRSPAMWGRLPLVLLISFDPQKKALIPCLPVLMG